MNNLPIGVFDSGLGGLSVWRELRARLPGESLYYFGDGKNCPYGPQSEEAVRAHVERGVAVMAERGIKMLVVACNAATAMAIEALRKTYDFPVIGMEPAVKPAAENTRTGVIGVLATAATFKGKLYQATAAKYADRVRIIERVGEGFVELVENGQEESPEAVDVVRRALEPMLEEGADHVVLGCTHYPFLERAMRAIIGGRDVEIVDPAPAILKRVESLLAEHALRADGTQKAVYEFFTAGDDAYLQRIIEKSGIGRRQGF